ncbi:MAG: hypothetical protein JWM11_2841 [Planctomycetaceae bacterium]|nr:hypothetical protein [Planctomycetaceae bacterium]
MTGYQTRCGTAYIAVWGILLAGCGTTDRDQNHRAKSPADVLERITEKGPVKLAVRIRPREPRLSDLVEMEVEVTAPPDVEIKPPAFGQAVGDFLVRDYSEVSKAKQPPASDGTSIRRFRYQLEPVQAGRHLIRSVGIEFLDHRPESETKGKPVLIESEPLEVLVTSELGDQVPNLADLEPMLPPRPLAGSFQWAWFLGAAGVVAAVVLAIWQRRRRKIRVQEPRRQTPEEIAHAALATLLSENLPAQGLFKEFYLRLTGIVRYYIEGTTGLRAPEQTTEEFLRAIRSRDVFPVERSVRLIEFLEAADMVKYAGQQPGEDQIQVSIARAREFVDLRGGPDTNHG